LVDFRVPGLRRDHYRVQMVGHAGIMTREDYYDE
jgi:hypothetical protein